MVNMISNVSAAADKRGGFVMGAFPLSDARTFEPGSTGVVARPRAYWPSHVVGAHGFAAGYGLVLGQHNPSKQFDASTTRIAAASGGALGSHPAREPV
jgi:hypothetical protein